MKELRRLLAMFIFYRHILPHTASTQAPLNAFLIGSKNKNKNPIQCTAESLQAFKKFCKRLSLRYQPTIFFRI